MGGGDTELVLCSTKDLSKQEQCNRKNVAPNQIASSISA